MDIEAESDGAATDDRSFPPLVYVPCAPERPGDTELSVDLRMTRDGRMAMLVYSALDRLVDKAGPSQPWTVMLTRDLEDVRLRTGFDLVCLDMDIPEEFRRTGAGGQ
jgi:hypothetical protein